VQTVTNSFGPAVIAGCSAANKAVNLVSTVPINWGNALSNFVGQNMGAEKPERIGQGVKVSLLVTGVLSLVMVLVMELMPKTLIGWFVEGEGAAEVVRVGASYLRVTGLFLVIFSVYMVMKSVFKGAGDMNWYVGLTLGSLGVRVFCAFLLAPVFGESILWWSVAVGWCVSAVPTVLHYLGGSWKKHSLVGKL
jgi:Na+-driven multidrug efflux pump